jgi:thiamine-monophosphate kinase
VGIGDDGAVFKATAGNELVTVVDTLVGKVHFPVDIGAADLGYRAVAVNLSDIAAMGAKPRWMTLALTLPSAEPGWLEAFSNGLFEAAAEHDVLLIGGDTTRGDTVVVSVNITGEIPAGRAILRSGARVGDTIFVTGTLGDAAGGLAMFKDGHRDGALVQRYLRPTARVRFGQSLVGVATAAIDISDGLLGDLGKLLESCGLGASVEVSAIPVSDELTAAFDSDAVRRFAQSGGDDYELCFTASEKPADLPDDLRVSAIGTITDSGELLLHDNGRTVRSADSGYRHFE